MRPNAPSGLAGMSSWGASGRWFESQPARSLVDFSIRARIYDAPLGTQSAGSQVESQVVLSVQDGWRRLGTSKLLFSLDTGPQQAPRKELPKLRVATSPGLNSRGRKGCVGPRDTGHSGGVAYPPHKVAQHVGLGERGTPPTGANNLDRVVSPYRLQFSDLIKVRREHTERGAERPYARKLRDFLVIVEVNH